LPEDHIYSVSDFIELIERHIPEPNRVSAVLASLPYDEAFYIIQTNGTPTPSIVQIRSTITTRHGDYRSPNNIFNYLRGLYKNNLDAFFEEIHRVSEIALHDPDGVH
jgi:hypothetical protein